MADQWTIVRSVGAIMLPLVVAAVGGAYALAAKQSENQVRYVELAITQLRSAPTSESAALRDWAIELLDSQSPVKLSAAARAQLKSAPLASPVSLAAEGKASVSGQGNLSTAK